MYMVEKKKGKLNRKNAENEPSSLNTKQALDNFLKTLKQGHNDEIVQLFLKDQAFNFFPKGGDTLKWLTNNIGKKAATKTVLAFASLVCFNCKEGLQSCKNCNGTGHIDYEMVCESCLGLTKTPCDFCGGTGWASIDCIPPGLRLAVFGVRLEIAEKNIVSMLETQLPKLSNEKATAVFNKCANLLFDLNRQIGVLESTVGITRSLVKVPVNLKKQVSKITRKCVLIALRGEKKLGEIIETMIAACKLQKENEEKGSKMHKFVAAQIKFYSELLITRPRYAGTYLEHPFLNEAAKSYNPKLAKSIREC